MFRTTFAVAHAVACVAVLPLTVSWSTPVTASDDHAVLETIVVTASRRAQTLEEVNASVDVISTDALARFSSASVADVLQYSTGAFARSSGANATVSLRGFNANHTAVLVDGLRRTDKYGSPNLSNLGLTGVERIEVIRGPMSALYGSDALGGVVNIIPAWPEDGLSVNLRTLAGVSMAGQRETRIVQASIGHGGTNIDHQLGLEYRKREPQRLSSAALADTLGGRRVLAAEYRGRWYSDASDLRWTLEVLDQDDRSTAVAGGPVPAVFEGFEKERRYFGSLVYDRELGSGDLTLRAGSGRSDASTTRSFPQIETSDSTLNQFEAIVSQPAASWVTLTGGAGWQRDTLEVTIAPGDNSRRQWFALGQAEADVDERWQLQAGVRYDRFSDFGDVVNPRVGVSWAGDAWRLRAGYGKAFRAPSLIELNAEFLRGPFIVRGNRALDPERSRSVEAAAEYRGVTGLTELIVHRSRVDDLITSVRTGEQVQGRFVSLFSNVEEARLTGVEFRHRMILAERWSLDASAEWLRAENLTLGERLSDRAARQYRAALTHQASAWALTLRGRHVSGYRNTLPGPPGSPVLVTNLSLADLRLDVSPAAGWTVFFGIDNLTDRRPPDNFFVVGAPLFDPVRRYVYAGVDLAVGGGR